MINTGSENLQHIELMLSCAELRPLEGSSYTSDEICSQIAIYCKDCGQTELLGKTEQKKNNRSPIYNQTVRVEFSLNQKYFLKVNLNYNGYAVASQTIELQQVLAKGDYGLTGTFYSNEKKKLGVFRVMYREIGTQG